MLNLIVFHIFMLLIIFYEYCKVFFTAEGGVSTAMTTSLANIFPIVVSGLINLNREAPDVRCHT